MIWKCRLDRMGRYAYDYRIHDIGGWIQDGIEGALWILW